MAKRNASKKVAKAAAQAAVATVAQLAKKTKRRQRSKSTVPKSVAMSESCWYESLGNPWVDCASYVPDDNTLESAKVQSRSTLAYRLKAVTTNAVASRSGMVLMLPYANDAAGYYSVATFAEDSAGDGTIVPGTTNQQFVYPANISAMRAGSQAGSRAYHRCVSMGVRVTYEGTELQRAGTIRAGLIPMVAGSSAGSTWKAVFADLSNATVGGFGNNLIRPAWTRVTDKTFEYDWAPSGVPHYMQLPISGETAGQPGAAGTLGPELGQNAIVILFEGDQSGNAATGNTYRMDFVWNWELVPPNPASILAPLTDSFFLPNELAHVLNTRLKVSQGKAFDVVSDAPGSSFGGMLSSLGQALGITSLEDAISVGANVHRAGKQALRVHQMLAGNGGASRLLLTNG
jgi:hypothetical protein